MENILFYDFLYSFMSISSIPGIFAISNLSLSFNNEMVASIPNFVVSRLI